MTRGKQVLLFLLLLVHLGSLGRAQFPVDGWAWNGVFNAAGMMDSNFQYMWYAGGNAAQTGIACDTDGHTGLYVSAAGPPEQYNYDPLNTTTPLQGVGLLSTWADFAGPLETTRDWVYFVDTRNGNVNRCRKSVPAQTGILLTNPGQHGITSSICSIVSNGRELFFTTIVSATSSYHLYAIDVQSSGHAIRPVAAFPVGSSPRWGPALALGPEGDLLAMDDPWMYRINAVSGTVSTLFAKPVDPAFTNTTYQFWPILMAYNPWTDEVVVSPKDQTYHLFGPPMVLYVRSVAGSAISSWQLAFAFNLGAHALTSLAIRPFELFGSGCANGTGRDPRLGWQGLPQQGQAFSITLRDAEPNGFAFFWLGLSDTYWTGFGALPFDAGPLGAPGCVLRVAADVPFPVPVDGNGQAVLQESVPINPALRGLQVFAQSVSSSTANAFGFAASDALVIRVR
jgi:hypothetical protein